MKIHEYQAKAILGQIRRPCAARRGGLHRRTRREAAAQSSAASVVVKAQIHAGGRGKGGGVKVAKDADEAGEIAEQDPRHDADHAPDRPGRPPGAAAADRRDAADRDANCISASCSTACTGKPVFMASADRRHGHRRSRRANARDDSERSRSNRASALQPFQARKLAFGIGIPAASVNAAVACMMALAKAYEAIDASLAEINPLHPHQGRQGVRARRQDQLRRQRALPPQGSGRAARSERRGSARSGSLASSA